MLKRLLCAVLAVVTALSAALAVSAANVAADYSVSGFTVSINGADAIDFVRYSPGEYATSSALRESPGLVNLDGRIIAAHSADGVFSYDVPDAGIYTFWVRYVGGDTALFTVEVEGFPPEMEIDGLRLRLTGLAGVKDVTVGRGSLSTYRQCADNKVVQIFANKITAAKTYSYVLPEPGEYTACIRYADGRENAILRGTAAVIRPVVTADGLSVNVSNITGLQVIRTAPGTHATAGDVKRADGARAFSGKLIGGADSYTVYFPGEGTYTVAVQYLNAYSEVCEVELIKKAPVISRGAHSITFTGLDGLNILRYAPGEIASSSFFKSAPGNRYVKPAGVINDSVTVGNLDGTYSFLVQYNEGSQNIYVFDFTDEETPAEFEDIIDISDGRRLAVEGGKLFDAGLSTAEFSVISPEKKNQVFSFNAKWETADTVFHNIVEMPDGTYRMYYMASSDRRRIAYLKSTDGLTWTRPIIPTATAYGNRTNCVTGDTVNPAALYVFRDDNPGCLAGETLKGIYGQWGDGLFLELSTGDAGNEFLFWTEDPTDKTEVMLMGQMGDSSPATGGCYFDTLNTVYWDAGRGKYVAFVRGFHTGDDYQLSRDFVLNNPSLLIRDIRYAESDDCYTWSTPVPVTYNGGTDDSIQMYTNAAMPYYRADGLYIGIPTRYNIVESDPATHAVTKAYTDNMLMVSRDLTDWTRYDGQYMLPFDPSVRELTYGDCYPCVGMIETAPGEISLYMKEALSGRTRTVLYRYTLRADGFASYSAGPETGTLVTLPLSFDGDSMTVNVKTGASGSVVVRMTDAAGNTVESEPLTGDVIDGQVVFPDGALESMRSKGVRITFELTDAELYSFKFG